MSPLKTLVGALLTSIFAASAAAATFHYRVAAHGLVSSAPVVESPCVESTAIFNYTGTTQSLTVPESCHNVTISAWGAGGGIAGSGGGGKGGGGGYAKATFSISPGTVLSVNVGQAGLSAPGYAAYYGGCVSGTFNGGGGACNGAGQGGGASHVFWGAAIHIVAGGGGGSGQNPGENGGPGGGLVGGNGTMPGGVGFGSGGNTTTGVPGAGATYKSKTSKPGSAWSGTTVGLGGDGASYFAMNNYHSGGGGGGGYFGGGAGVPGYDTFMGGSGGGGSSFVAASGTGIAVESGFGTTPGGRADPTYQGNLRIGEQMKHGQVTIRIF